MATKSRTRSKFAVIATALTLVAVLLAGCSQQAGTQGASDSASVSATATQAAAADALSYAYNEFPLERAGVALHLDRIQVEGTKPERDILLVHGVTYSSHEFDIDYADYSFARFLARQGYAVWRLDVAGFGRSQAVTDGFMPDSAYASEDVNAAVERIVEVSGHDKIDVLGWSWGTVTSSLFAKNHPEHLNRLVLYAPILSGLGEVDVNEPFHANDWEHAASDFQLDAEGNYDPNITDPVMVEMYCSSCWHYDKDSSPNGGRRDLCVGTDVELIDLSAIHVPTLVIHGDADPYLNYDLLATVQDKLPEGSKHVVIPGGAHVVMYEKPYYHEFQDAVADFLG